MKQASSLLTPFELQFSASLDGPAQANRERFRRHLKRRAHYEHNLLLLKLYRIAYHPVQIQVGLGGSNSDILSIELHTHRPGGPVAHWEQFRRHLKSGASYLDWYLNINLAHTFE